MKIILFIIFFVISFEVNALRPYVPVECLVNKSDEIFIARFIGESAVPVYSDAKSELYMARFENVKMVKGYERWRVVPKTYNLLWRKGVPEHPDFNKGKLYVIFIAGSDIGPYILYGERGVLKIEGESDSQLLKIKNYINDKKKIDCDWLP